MYTRLFFACIAFLFFSSILAQCPTIPSADGDIDLNGLADENNGGGFSTTVSGWKYSVRICKVSYLKRMYDKPNINLMKMLNF